VNKDAQKRVHVVAQAEKGVVRCVSDVRHLLDVGDEVTFSEVKGMTQVNGVTPHPVTLIHGIVVQSASGAASSLSKAAGLPWIWALPWGFPCQVYGYGMRMGTVGSRLG